MARGHSGVARRDRLWPHKKSATAAVQALALQLIADRLEHGETLPGPMEVSFFAA